MFTITWVAKFLPQHVLCLKLSFHFIALRKNAREGRKVQLVFGKLNEVDGTWRQVTPHTRGPASLLNSETGGALAFSGLS